MGLLSADMFSADMWKDAQNMAISRGVDFLAGSVTNATLKTIVSSGTGELGYLIYYMNADIFDPKNILVAKGGIDKNKITIKDHQFIYDNGSYGPLTYTKEEPFIRLDGINYTKYKIGEKSHEALVEAGGISAIMYTKVTLYYDSNISQNLINTAANIAGLANTGAAIYDVVSDVDKLENVLTTVVQSIISKGIEIITEQITTMLSNYVAKHTAQLTQFPKNVTKNALEYFNENKKSIADVIKEKGLNKDIDPNEGLNEKNKKVKEFMNKMQKNITLVTNKMNSITTQISEKINKAMDYAENGPDYILEIINKEIDKEIASLQEEIDKQWVKDEKAYKEKAESYGQDAGQYFVNMWNKELDSAAEQQLQKLQVVEKLLEIQKDQAICVAMSVLASKTGIYIPPAVISVTEQIVTSIPTMPVIG